MYYVQTIFWHKVCRGVILHLLQRLERFNLYETDKIIQLRFLAEQTDIRLRFTKRFTRTDKSSKDIRCPIALTRQNVRTNATSSSSYITTF